MPIRPVMDLTLSHWEAIKQWNKVQKIIDIDIYSPEMTYPKFRKSVLKYIESQ